MPTGRLPSLRDDPARTVLARGMTLLLLLSLVRQGNAQSPPATDPHPASQPTRQPDRPSITPTAEPVQQGASRQRSDSTDRDRSSPAASGQPTAPQKTPGRRSANEPVYETVVTARRMEERPAQDEPSAFATQITIRNPPAGLGLPQLLQPVPGLRIKEAGPGGRQSLSLRGTDSHQAVVVLDGIRLSSPAGGGVDLSLLDPAFLERVEVRRGGGGARYGSDALGGVLVLETPRLAARSITQASIGYGSWNSLAARLSHAGRRSDVRYWAGGTYQQSTGRFVYLDHNGVATARENNDSRHGEALIKLAYLRSSRWQLGFLDSFAVSNRGAPGLVFAPCTSARQDELTNHVTLHLDRRELLLRGGTLQLTLAHRYGSYLFDEVCAHNEPSRLRSHQATLRSVLALPLPGVGEVTAGLELRESLAHDLLGHLDESWPHRFEVDLWLASTMALWRKVVVLVPAVRVATTSLFGATVVPKAGLLLRPFRRTPARWLRPLTLAANIGRSFRYPSFQELYLHLDSLRGNTDLVPEDALEGDVGLRWQRRVLAVETAYFRRRIKNIILFAPVSPFLVEAQNLPRALAQGLELSVKAHPGWGLALSAAYTYTRTQFGEPARLELPGHPRHRLALRLGWRFPEQVLPTQPWSVELWSAAVVESSMFLDRFNSPTFEEEGRIMLSAGGSIGYRLLSLNLWGQNLLDKADAVDTLGFPLAPASFFIALALKK